MASISSRHSTPTALTYDDPELGELRERVRARGRSVTAAATALRTEVRHATDWRAHAARHPFWVLGASAVLGLCAASVLRRRARPEARLLEAAAGGLEGLAARLKAPGGNRLAIAGGGGLIGGVLRVLAGRALRHRLGSALARADLSRVATSRR